MEQGVEISVTHLAHVKQCIEENLQPPECGRSVLSIGVGTLGPIDLHDGTVLTPPNFPGMWGAALASTLAQTFDLPIRIDDDARMGTVAESMMGADREPSNFGYVFVGFGTYINRWLLDLGWPFIGFMVSGCFENISTRIWEEFLDGLEAVLERDLLFYRTAIPWRVPPFKKGSLLRI